MCGIAGILFRDGRVPEEPMLRRMAASIRHRGPDGDGIHRARNLGLVHTRLSILDLSDAGSQPMFLHDRSVGIVFNGEIYNFIELRQELETLGARFRSHCDTEVILWAYRIWGTECFARFNGMWALAIWDEPKQELILSRDRFGVKPLYYAQRGDTFLFASEAKAISASGEYPIQPDDQWLYQYLTYGHVDIGDETFFEGVKLFPKACYAIVRPGKLDFLPYWTFDPERFRKNYDYERPIEQMHDLFVDAVKIRLRSDVPVGSSLSGGLDSSAVVGVAAGLLPAGTRMHTFSSIYKEPEYSEETFIRAVVKHVDANAHYLYPTGDDAFNMSQLGVWSMEKPCAGPTLISQLNVMREAHRHVKVLLDGQGSDEYLAGYHPFFVYFLNSLWARSQKQPSMQARWTFWRNFFSIASVDCTNPFAWQTYQNLKAQYPSSRTLNWFGRFIPGKPPAPYQGIPMPGMIHPAFAERMKGREYPTPQFDRPYEDELDNVLYNQFFRQSIPSILLTEDANSMAFSVEARLPFMDYRLVEFMFGLDLEWKVRGWRTKYIQREALGRYLPKIVRERRDKKGYPTPYAVWLRGPIKEQMHEILFSRTFAQRELFNPECVRWLWDTHQSGAMDVSWPIYKVFSTELWFRMFIDRTLVPKTMNERLKAPVRQAA